MLTRRNSVLDGRGTRRRVLDMYWAAKPLGLKPRSLARPGDHADFKTEFLRTWLVPAAIAIPGVAMYALIRGFFEWEAMFFAALAILIGLAFNSLVMTLYLHTYTWKSARHGRDALLASGLCPSCGYGIVGVRAEPDGCTVCPECGAAWRVQHRSDGPGVPREIGTDGL